MTRLTKKNKINKNKINKNKTKKNKTKKNKINKNKTKKNIKQKNNIKDENNIKHENNIKDENKKYIDGPCTMYYYSNLPDERKLLIFGENHFTPNPCIDDDKPFTSIVEYLKEIAKKSTECVDIYIENDYKNKELTKYNNNSLDNLIYLNQLRREFLKCDDRNKTSCKYKNARIHFSDPRIILETNIIDTSGSIDKYIEDVMNGSILTMPELYLMRTNLSCDHYKRPSDYPKFKEVIKFLMGWKREEKYKNYYLDYISYITEGYSFDGIANSWCEKYFQIIDKEKKKIKHFSIEKIYKTLYKIYKNYYKDTSATFIISLCIPMDVYFIFRYLMNFKKSNMKRGPIGCRDTDYSKKTIIYCGYFHAETYKNFINNFFNVKSEISIEQINNGNVNSCLELPDNFEF